MRIAARQSTIRKNNQALILEHIIEYGQASRADLAKQLSISKPTISHNTEQLIEYGLLVEKGSGESKGGRKPMLLDFNYDHKIIIALDLNRNNPIIALSDLKGNILDRMNLKVNVEDGKPILIQKLTTGINELIEKNKYLLEKLGVISIAIPGVINEVTGEVYANPQFNLWMNLNLKEILSEIYHVPIIIKNDISMAALGEKHYGAGQNYDDLIYVSLGLGVGAGLILHGELFEGKRKAAGEIGYTRVFGLDSKKTLEEEISTLAIMSKVKEKIASNQMTNYDEIVSIDELNDLLNKKDPYIGDLVSTIGKTLGIAVSNIAIILDLEQIIIGGVLSALGQPLLSSVKSVVDELPFEVKVNQSELGYEAGIRGLVEIAKETIIKNLVE